MSYTVYYLRSQDKGALEAFIAGFRNTLPVWQGVEAVAEYTDDEGNVVPAQPKRGDPSYWYTAVSVSGLEIDEQSPVELCTKEEARLVVGEFFGL